MNKVDIALLGLIKEIQEYLETQRECHDAIQKRINQILEND